MDNVFVKECKNILQEDFIKILNLYANLYYKEDLNTEQGIVAMAINDLFRKAKELNMLENLSERN